MVFKKWSKRIASGLLTMSLLITGSLGTSAFAVTAEVSHGPLAKGEQVRGWNILSDSLNDDLTVINAAKDYDINHLQLSHDVVMDLKDIKDPAHRQLWQIL